MSILSPASKLVEKILAQLPPAPSTLQFSVVQLGENSASGFSLGKKLKHTSNVLDFGGTIQGTRFGLAYLRALRGLHTL